MFRIGDIEFNIAQATLDSFIDKANCRMRWGVEVGSIPIATEFLGMNPIVSSEILLDTFPSEIGKWTDLSGRDIAWDTPEDDNGEPYGLLYLFEHHPIYQSKVNLFCNSNTGLSIRWTGKVDLLSDERYWTDVPFEIETELKYKGIYCGREQEAVCRNDLSPFLNQDDFDFVQNENGVSLLIPKK